MEAQDYVSNLSASSVLDGLFKKVSATLNLDKPEEEAVLSPRENTAMPQTDIKQDIQPDIEKEGIEENKPVPDVKDVMNQSNVLPGKQTEIMVVDINGAVREDEQGKLAKQILTMLAQKGFTRPGTFILKRFDLSNGIELTAIPKAGPAISTRTKG
jgi:hypothetical protein